MGAQYSNTETIGRVIINLGRWIVHETSWSPILFYVTRSNVKVGVSLHSLPSASSLVLHANRWLLRAVKKMTDHAVERSTQ